MGAMPRREKPLDTGQGESKPAKPTLDGLAEDLDIMRSLILAKAEELQAALEKHVLKQDAKLTEDLEILRSLILAKAEDLQAALEKDFLKQYVKLTAPFNARCESLELKFKLVSDKHSQHAAGFISRTTALDTRIQKVEKDLKTLLKFVGKIKQQSCLCNCCDPAVGGPGASSLSELDILD